MYPNPMIYEWLMRERGEEWQRTAAQLRLLSQLRPSQRTLLQRLTERIYALFSRGDLSKAFRPKKSHRLNASSLHKAQEEV